MAIINEKLASKLQNNRLSYNELEVLDESDDITDEKLTDKIDLKNSLQLMHKPKAESISLSLSKSENSVKDNEGFSCKNLTGIAL